MVTLSHSPGDASDHLTTHGPLSNEPKYRAWNRLDSRPLPVLAEFFPDLPSRKLQDISTPREEIFVFRGRSNRSHGFKKPSIRGNSYRPMAWGGCRKEVALPDGCSEPRGDYIDRNPPPREFNLDNNIHSLDSRSIPPICKVVSDVNSSKDNPHFQSNSDSQNYNLSSESNLLFLKKQFFQNIKVFLTLNF